MFEQSEVEHYSTSESEGTMQVSRCTGWKMPHMQQIQEVKV